MGTCSDCGYEVTPGDNFCSNCGVRYDPASAQVSSDAGSRTAGAAAFDDRPATAAAIKVPEPAVGECRFREPPSQFGSGYGSTAGWASRCGRSPQPPTVIASRR
jgi:hypothetical protein